MASAQQARPSSARGTAPPAAVRVDRTDTATRIVLSGEVDAESEPQLTRAGDEALSRGLPVEVACSAVTFMDSTGVSFLALLASRADAPVTLLSPPDIVRFLVETTGIAPMVRMAPEGPEA